MPAKPGSKRGIFLGAKRFGDGDNREKRCLVLDIEEYRFQKFVSDLAGMDITEHGGDPRRMVGRVRDWLVTVSQRRTIPSTQFILTSYDDFNVALSDIAKGLGLESSNLAYADLERLVLRWVKPLPPRRR